MSPEFKHLEGDESVMITLPCTLDEALRDRGDKLLAYAKAWASLVPWGSVWWIDDELFNILHAAIYVYGDWGASTIPGFETINELHIKSIILRRRSRKK